MAPHGEPRKAGDVDLRDLVERGLLRHLPPEALENPPRIAAGSPAERAALGYLHGNCGHCHNDNGAPVPVDLALWQGWTENPKVMRSLLGASRYRAPGAHAASAVVEPGRPEASVLMARMRSRNPQTQMPPLGTVEPDNAALALVERWIRTQPQARKEH
jgi:mono/diheme cytochrome c family protein